MPWAVTDELKQEAVAMLNQVYSELPIFDDIVQAAVQETALGQRWFDQMRARLRITAGVPVAPMLAKPMTSIGDLITKFAGTEFTSEYKYDGERAQIHMFRNAGGEAEFRVYSRNSENHTGKYPDIVEAVRGAYDAAAVSSFIVDSEAVAYDPATDELLPFQVLSSRAKKDVTMDKIKVKVKVFFFDLLLLNDEVLLETELVERRRRLRDTFRAVPGKVAFATAYDGKSEEDLQSFLDKAVEDKTEGLMVKKTLGPDSFYTPSARSVNWAKLKKDYLDGAADSFDLVPIAAWHGVGKRAGVFGSFLLASYDEDSEEFRNVCCVGTGLSEEQLTAFAKHFNDGKIEASKPFNVIVSPEMLAKKPDVWFTPSLVWEIKCADLTLSKVSRAAFGIAGNDTGVNLRFPRLVRNREDKKPEEATSDVQLLDAFRGQAGRKTAAPADADDSD
jgi:DNA ligase-1